MRASESGGTASPAEDISFDAAPDIIPGLERRRASFDGGHSPLYLSRPLGLGIWVGRSVRAGAQFGGQLGPSMLVETQGIGQDSGCSLSHDNPILRLDRPPAKRLQPTAPGAIMRRRG
jgi:hypothetical protein